MTVSGLGSSHTSFLMLRPHPAAKAKHPERATTDFDRLTDADRELIRQATGQRIAPGFDPAKEPASGFAAAIAADRASGLLAPGQEVTAMYLKDRSHRYDRVPGPNPFTPYLEKAFAYLAGTGRRTMDVTA
jgi:hypothetical protein